MHNKQPKTKNTVAEGSVRFVVTQFLYVSITTVQCFAHGTGAINHFINVIDGTDFVFSLWGIFHYNKYYLESYSVKY